MLPKRRFYRACALIVAIVVAGCAAAEEGIKLPVPALDEKPAAGPWQKAVVAGGCFWGVQGVFQHLKGVKNAVSGYSGGDRSTAKYSRIGEGDTGHAEAVEILYDPAQVTYGQILQVFFSVAHDPTQLNRQGPDTGTQYRSAIFYANDSQKRVAEAYIKQLDGAGVYSRRIVTKVDPLRAFYPAEDYHQDYLLRNPRQAYIVINDLPKVRNFERLLPALWMPTPVTVKGFANAPAPPADESAGSMMMSAAAAEKPEAMSGAMMSAAGAAGPARTEGELPALTGATGWLNSKPLTRESLRGKVVVVDFWTYSCINCLRTMPYVNAWYRHYKDHGLVVLGVHSPEFAFEKDTANVEAAVKKFEMRYPIALDSNLAIWKAFNNKFWPAHYFVDAKGNIRGHHFGEGKYARSERTIRQLLTEAGAKNLPDPLDDAAGQGVNAQADTANVKSPETYLGFARAENFVSPGSFSRDAVKAYEVPKALALNQWGLSGRWNVSGEKARLTAAPGRVAFKFRARDLHLVLGSGAKGVPVRFRVLLDGKPPGNDHGLDVDAQGNGTVREQRLYQLIRQKGAVDEHEFTIEFLDANVEAYAFTFG